MSWQEVEVEVSYIFQTIPLPRDFSRILCLKLSPDSIGMVHNFAGNVGMIACVYYVTYR